MQLIPQPTMAAPSTSTRALQPQPLRLSARRRSSSLSSLIGARSSCSAQDEHSNDINNNTLLSSSSSQQQAGTAGSLSLSKREESDQHRARRKPLKRARTYCSHYPSSSPSSSYGGSGIMDQPKRSRTLDDDTLDDVRCVSPRVNHSRRGCADAAVRYLYWVLLQREHSERKRRSPPSPVSAPALGSFGWSAAEVPSSSTAAPFSSPSPSPRSSHHHQQQFTFASDPTAFCLTPPRMMSLPRSSAPRTAAAVGYREQETAQEEQVETDMDMDMDMDTSDISATCSFSWSSSSSAAGSSMRSATPPPPLSSLSSPSSSSSSAPGKQQKHGSSSSMNGDHLPTCAPGSLVGSIPLRVSTTPTTTTSRQLRQPPRKSRASPFAPDDTSTATATASAIARGPSAKEDYGQQQHERHASAFAARAALSPTSSLSPCTTLFLRNTASACPITTEEASMSDRDGGDGGADAALARARAFNDLRRDTARDDSFFVERMRRWEASHVLPASSSAGRAAPRDQAASHHAPLVADCLQRKGEQVDDDDVDVELEIDLGRHHRGGAVATAGFLAPAPARRTAAAAAAAAAVTHSAQASSAGCPSSSSSSASSSGSSFTGGVDTCDDDDDEDLTLVLAPPASSASSSTTHELPGDTDTASATRAKAATSQRPGAAREPEACGAGMLERRLVEACALGDYGV